MSSEFVPFVQRTTKVKVTLLSLLISFPLVLEASEQFSLFSQPALLFDDSGSSEPITGEANGIPYEIIQGYAISQGDMVLGKMYASGELEIRAQTRGLGQQKVLDRWPDGIIPFQFSAEITETQRKNALEAIEHWNTRSKIFLTERTEALAEQYPNYVNFEPSNGCASWVGRVGGEQAVWVADSCTVGSIIHEIGHAIGLFHEHTRPDRDNYITVNWDNITNGKDFNFDIIENNVEMLEGYDYGSIMHYGDYFFSKNGQLTIEAPDGVEIGQRIAASEIDINSVNTMYATDLQINATNTVVNDNFKIELNITNLGDLGANQLTFTANLGEDADWVSISSKSGWACQQFGTDLKCTKETLEESQSSVFSLIATPNGATFSDFSARVESRTHDTNLNNNVINDEIPVESSTEQADTSPTTAAGAEGGTSTITETPDDTQQPTETNSNSTPDIGAASTPLTTDSTTTTSSNSGGSSGGATSLAWLAALLSLAFLKRRTKS